MAEDTFDVNAAATDMTATGAATTSALASEAFAETETAAGPDAGGVLQSAFCGSLRSKKFFMLAGLATEAGQYLDASNHCWCRETQMVFGPDGGRARPDRCGPDRSCYTSALGGD